MSPKPTEVPMPEDDPAKLKRILAGIEDKGNQLAQMGRGLTASGTQAADLAAAAGRVVRYSPTLAVDLIPHFQLLERQIAGVAAVAQRQLFVSGLMSTTTSVASAVFLALGTGPIVGRWTECGPNARAAFDSFKTVVFRGAREEDVVSLMRGFGLDAPYEGETSAIDQFKTAMAAFAIPSVGNGTATPSLISMRSAITMTVASLNKRKPVQKPTGGNEQEKIQSIARQLKREGISQEIVDRWATEWGDLNNRLSEAKTGDISREDCESRLIRGASFLKALLEGLDPTKLRH